jgi:hypothetical protein
MNKFATTLRQSSLVLYLLVGLTLILSALLPTLAPRSASAAQITKRQLSISTGVPGATSVTYTFGASTGGSDTTSGFFFGTSHIVRGMKFEACTTAVGTCTGPTGFSFASASGFTLTGWQDTTAFTKDNTNQNDCDGTQARILCISRSTASTAENTTTSHKIVVTGVTNPSTTNSSFFIRMTTYTNATYTAGSATDTGTVASATTQSLTVSAVVAEVLNFCVGATTVNDATTSVATDCTGVSGTTVNIGTLDTSFTNVSPVNVNGGNNNNGVAMLRTNAVNGATVSYRAIQQSGTNQLGTLRISGATCDTDENSVQDQCIKAQGTTQGNFSASNERFGMTIAAINCGSVTSYTCTFTSGTYNLVRDADYDGNGGNTYPTDSGTVSGTTNAGYAWDPSGSFDQIASSTGSTTKVVDDEALILKFAATPSITTPTGSYTAQADFIAVATY